MNNRQFEITESELRTIQTQMGKLGMALMDCRDNGKAIKEFEVLNAQMTKLYERAKNSLGKGKIYASSRVMERIA